MPPSTAALAALLMLAMVLGSAGRAVAAGYHRAEIPATSSDPALAVILWFPCARPAMGSRLGPYMIDADSDCTADGRSLPLIAISHGKGGSYVGHHDTAVALANAGFVVVSVNHPGDNFSDESAGMTVKVFETRPRDVSRAITFVLSEWSERERIDATAIGVFGFSRGGYTALTLIGAQPDVAASSERLCGSWWSFVNSLCRELGSDDAAIDARSDSRVRAAVVVDPLHLFDPAGLKTVAAPVQLWASELGGDGVELVHVEAIRAALPTAPEFHVARGAGHFAFLAPCPTALADAAPDICEDPEGFDRAALHRTMNDAVVAFFKRQLQAAGDDASTGSSKGSGP